MAYICCTYILLAWLVVLYENLEKIFSAILFFVLTFVAFVYLLVQLIWIIIYKLEYYPSSAGANGEPGSGSTNANDGVGKPVATKDTKPFIFNTNKLTWKNILVRSKITYRNILIILIILLIIIILWCMCTTYSLMKKRRRRSN